MSKNSASGPVKPKAPSKNAGVKAWDAYIKRLRAWKTLKARIRAALSIGKSPKGKRKGRR